MKYIKIVDIFIRMPNLPKSGGIQILQRLINLYLAQETSMKNKNNYTSVIEEVFMLN